MKIKPDDRWKWYFDAEFDRLMLDLANGMVFRSRLAGRFLIADIFSGCAFTVEDTAQYYDYMDGLHASPLTSAQKAELVLNAVAAQRFLKPVMPKSWYFAQINHGYSPEMGELVQVQLVDGEEKVLLFVVENSGNASLCLVAQPQMILNDRPLALGEPIKVMNDRLSPASTLAYGAYACAG